MTGRGPDSRYGGYKEKKKSPPFPTGIGKDGASTDLT